MTLKSDVKFEDKLTCGLENDMRNLADFYQSTLKYQNWDKMMQNLRRMTCRFKTDSRNLTNVDTSTRKSKKISLLMDSF